MVRMSREMVVSGQRDSPGKCHNSRPMVASAPDLRRLHLWHLFSTRTLSFAESPTLEEPWKKLPLNYHHPSFIQTPGDLSILYSYHVHQTSTDMPEANGYYCQCIDLTTAKHTPPDKRGICRCRKDARHSTYHQGTYLRARGQPKHAVRAKVRPFAPHDSRIILASTWVSTWEFYSLEACSGFTTLRQIASLETV